MDLGPRKKGGCTAAAPSQQRAWADGTDVGTHRCAASDHAHGRTSAAGASSVPGTGGARPALTPPSRTRRPASSSRSRHTVRHCSAPTAAAWPSSPSLSAPLPSPRLPLAASPLQLSLLSSSSSLPPLLPSSPLPLPLPLPLPSSPLRPPLAPSGAPAAAPGPPCCRLAGSRRRRGGGGARPSEGRSSSASITPGAARRMAATRQPSSSPTFALRLRLIWPHLLAPRRRRASGEAAEPSDGPSAGACCPPGWGPPTLEALGGCRAAGLARHRLGVPGGPRTAISTLLGTPTHRPTASPGPAPKPTAAHLVTLLSIRRPPCQGASSTPNPRLTGAGRWGNQAPSTRWGTCTYTTLFGLPCPPRSASCGAAGPGTAARVPTGRVLAAPARAGCTRGGTGSVARARPRCRRGPLARLRRFASRPLGLREHAGPARHPTSQ
jgi:hypothetical protein